MQEPNGFKPISEKIGTQICPFMSSGKDLVPCSARCKLYRQTKAGSPFQCPFQELPSMSWQMKVAVTSQVNKM